jgi:hypothetical protein
MPAESAGILSSIGYRIRGDGDDAMEHSDSVFERAVAVGGLAAHDRANHAAVDDH